MNPFKQYLDLLAANRELVCKGSFPAMNALRDQAEQALRNSSEPTKDYTAFSPDYGLNLSRIPFNANIYDTFKQDIPNLSSLMGAVVNDCFLPSQGLYERLPEGVEFCSLKEAYGKHPEMVGEYLGKLSVSKNQAVLVNNLLAQDGVFIHIADGARIEKPLELVNIFNSTQPFMAVRRVLIVAGKNSYANIVIADHTQCADAQLLDSQVIETYAMEGAHLAIYELENSTPNTLRYSSHFVKQQGGSSFNLGSYTLNCGETHNFTRVICSGNYTETFMGGMAIAANEQKVWNATEVQHSAKNGKSNQLYKYVVSEDASGSFVGRVLVNEGATGTEAYQSNRNMLATETAKMHTEPQLEIYCDDVKCSHGATTGQLDAEALFYMRTRGIPEHEARVMLMQAFMADVLDSIKLEPLRQRMHILVEQRFAGHRAACTDCQAQCPK